MELAALFEHVLDYSPTEGNLSRLPTRGGVYLLTDAENRTIQLAATADLKRALVHRLSTGSEPAGSAPEPAGKANEDATDRMKQPVADEFGEQPQIAPPGPQASKPAIGRRRINLSEIVRRIWWQPAHSQFELAYTYYRLARLLMPRTYRKQVGFGPAWFVHVDTAAPLPQFAAGKLLRSAPTSIRTGISPRRVACGDLPDGRSPLPGGTDAGLTQDRATGIDLGPFATQADAARFIEILQDTFDLCRYHHILEQAPHGQACAYFEMGKCPAPCDGSIPLSEYRIVIEAALRFACGEREATYEQIASRMRDAAGRQQYERAGMLKKLLERAKDIEHAAFARVAPIEEFNYVILQRGSGTTRVQPFFVRQGVIAPGRQVKRAEVADALASWRQGLHGPTKPNDPDEWSEHVWLVSHFLFKPEKPGLYLHANELTDPARVLRMVEENFPARRSAATPAEEREPETLKSQGSNLKSEM